MSNLEGLIKPTIEAAFNPTFNRTNNIDMSTDKTETHSTYNLYQFNFGKPLFWLLLLYGVFWCVTNLPSCSYSPLTPRPSSLESQVRTWAGGYPDALRDRWAWCYLDSAENWSTDQKLREDVRLKSVQVLTDSERQTLIPLDDKIAEAIPQQKTPLKETYYAVGKGLRVNEWSPVGDGREEKPPPEPQPIRRRIFNRR